MGAVVDILDELRSRHDELSDSLAKTLTEQMPIMGHWGQREMPIRNMFYQVLTHVAEHTVQVIKTRQLLGLEQSEAQLILAQLRQLHGTLEGLLVGLSDEELAREPEGEWSIRQTLDHIIRGEGSYGKRVVEALAAEKPAG